MLFSHRLALYQKRSVCDLDITLYYTVLTLSVIYYNSNHILMNCVVILAFLQAWAKSQVRPIYMLVSAVQTWTVTKSKLKVTYNIPSQDNMFFLVVGGSHYLWPQQLVHSLISQRKEHDYYYYWFIISVIFFFFLTKSLNICWLRFLKRNNLLLFYVIYLVNEGYRFDKRTKLKISA